MAELRLTEEERSQIAADPSILNSNPELVERYDRETAAMLVAETPPIPPVEEPTPPVVPAAEPPPVVAAELVAPPAPPAEPAAPPEWLKEIPEASRKTVIEAWLRELPPAERAALGPVSELLAEVDQTAEQRGAQRGIVRDAAAVLDQARTGLVERYNNNLITDFEADLRAQETAAKTALQGEMSSDVTRGLKAALSQAGIRQIPQAILDQAAQVTSIGDAVQVYAEHLGRSVYQAGIDKGRADGGVVSEADRIVNQARMRHEVLADVAKDKRIRIGQDEGGLFAQLIENDIPPLIEGQVAVAAGRMAADEYSRRLAAGEMSEADIDASTRHYTTG